MLATRGLFLTIVALMWALNGWLLAQSVGWLPVTEGAAAAIALANIIAIPMLVWSAYRTGELVEEQLHRKN